MRALDPRFRLVRLIGRGGIGEVYEAVQVALDRKVAIKLLRTELTQRADVVARFEQEARTTSRLQHPNVVTVIDVGTTPDGSRFLVMELLEGQTLAQHLEERGSLPPEEVLEIATQVVRGMGAGQGVGLVHRDLKPENIFLAADQHVKILDFGIALLLEGQRALPPLPPAERLDDDPTEERPVALDTLLPDPDAPPVTASQDHLVGGRRRNSSGERLTRPGAIVGTPVYMAPEQALGWEVDHRSDLYSFGCVLYEMLTGRAPFEADTVGDLLHAHVHLAPVPPSGRVPDLPPALDRLVMRLLAKDPNARFQDWAALAEELRRLRALAPRGGARGERAPERRPTEPYRFLQPFSAGNATIFFGRDDDARRFRELWEHPDQVPVTLLTGTSGVGKSSFLHARVIPGLEDTGHEVILVRGGDRPMAAVREAAERLMARSTAPGEVVPTPRLLDQLSARVGRPVAVVVDQLEELLTHGKPADIVEFQAELASQVSGGDREVRFLLSLREDFLGPLLRALDPLPLELARTLPLRSLGPADLAEALEGPGRPGLPVDYAPFRFEPGLVDLIVRDLLADPAGEVAPRVQAAGARLWEMVKNDPVPVITFKHYRNGLGGAGGILGRVLDEAIADLPPTDQGVAKELLRALTHLPGSPTSAPAPESTLLGAHADPDRRLRVLRRLESPWRVVHGYTDPRWPEERSYRIAHEALVARIQDYGEENAGRNRARQLFQQSLNLWLKGGRQDQDLLPEEHFNIVFQHAEALVLRTEDARLFYAKCKELHDENWWRRVQAERNARIRRLMLTGAVPVAAVALGAVLGQVPVDFTSFQGLKARTMDALAMNRAGLAGASLALADLSGLELLAPDLRGADLRHARLTDARLEQADLSEARLEGADLSGAFLVGATLDRADLHRASLRGADLRAASLDTDLADADLLGALFDYRTRWREGPPPLALGPNGNAEGADLSAVVVRDADLGGMKLTGANLEGASFVHVRLVKADLAQARAAGVDLAESNLDGASLAGIDLSGACLQETNLRLADLQGAKLDNATLVGAALLGANMEGASFAGAVVDARTRFPGEIPAGVQTLGSTPGLSAPHACLRGVDLRDLDLSGADLSAADLRKSDLRGANLCGADLSGAQLAEARLEGVKSCPTTKWPGGKDPSLDGS